MGRPSEFTFKLTIHHKTDPNAAPTHRWRWLELSLTLLGLLATIFFGLRLL